MEPDVLKEIIKKIKALGYFKPVYKTKEDPRVIADSIGYEVRRRGVAEGRINLYYKSKSAPFIEACLKNKRMSVVMPKTWRFTDDIKISEGSFKNIEVYSAQALCSVDLSKKTQHEIEMDALLDGIWGVNINKEEKMSFGGFGRRPDTQIKEQMDRASSKIN